MFQGGPSVGPGSGNKALSATRRFLQLSHLRHPYALLGVSPCPNREARPLSPVQALRGWDPGEPVAPVVAAGGDRENISQGKTPCQT